MNGVVELLMIVVGGILVLRHTTRPDTVTSLACWGRTDSVGQWSTSTPHRSSHWTPFVGLGGV